MGKRKDFKALKEAGMNFVKITTRRVITELLRFRRETSRSKQEANCFLCKPRHCYKEAGKQANSTF
jgi:hypothetical protein